MASSINSSIYKALAQHLQGFTLPDEIGGIAWHGVEFPGNGQPKPDNYLYAQLYPNKNTSLFLSGPDKKQGIWQVSVEWLVNPENHIFRAMQIADLIAEHYPRELKLTEGDTALTIYSEPEVATPLIDEGRATIPVSISYHSFS